MIIKPTFLFLIYAFIFWQVPFVYLSYECEKFLPNPYALLGMIHAFVLVGLFLTSRLYAPQTQEIWSRLINKDNCDQNIEQSYNYFLYFIIGLMIVCLTVYFSYVSLENTPLILSLKGADTQTIILARENSLNTLDSFVPKYAYTFFRSSLSVCIVCFAGFASIQSLKEKKYIHFFLYLFLILTSTFFSSLILNKSNISLLLIGFFLNFVWGDIKYPLKTFLWIISLITASILLAVLVTSLAYYHSLDHILITIWPLINRAFIVTFKVGSWYIHYAQLNDFIGISAFPKLALIYGIEPVYLPNFIGKIYAPIYYNHEVLSSVGANAGFLFVNYAAWGIVGLPISLCMLMFLDIAIPVMMRLPKTYLIPFLSMISVLLISFTASTYGTSLISHGYLTSIAVVYTWICRNDIMQFFKRFIKTRKTIFEFKK